MSASGGGGLLLGDPLQGGLLLGGVYFPGDVCFGGCLLPEGVVSQHALRQTPPVDRMTDTCKNITFANFVCGW